MIDGTDSLWDMSATCTAGDTKEITLEDLEKAKEVLKRSGIEKLRKKQEKNPKIIMLPPDTLPGMQCIGFVPIIRNKYIKEGIIMKGEVARNYLRQMKLLS